MLAELVVTDLGVIAEMSLVFGPGMTAVTGETGAGKTLIVGAIDLLVGGRAESTMVRAGAAEAVVEGRFVFGDDEVVLRRVVPREGRSRAYVDGHLATVTELADWGRRLVDLHGQHAHQSLLSTTVQRAALDRFGGIDLEPLEHARKELATIDERLAALGGDERERARELDLLRFQVAELETAALTDAAEDDRLELEEDLQAGALEHREAADRTVASLTTDGGAGDRIAEALGLLAGRSPFADVEARLRSVAAELSDLSAELRTRAESIEDDPARLEEIRSRRQLLHELKRKYGDQLADVLVFRDEISGRLGELEGREEAAARLEVERQGAHRAVVVAEKLVGHARRAAAPELATAVEAHLRDLALEKARLEIEVGDDPGDLVVIRFSANPGAPALPLAKVASGGELARTMLALRLVLSEAPDTLVFDEVDAGIGGAAAGAVALALAALGAEHQVLVVTHLAQVAAAADQQAMVTKDVRDDETFTSITTLDDDGRVEEVSRMLSGTPESTTARDHARELLDRASRPEAKR